MNSQKGFAPVLVLIVAVIIIAAGGYYVVTQTNTTSTVQTAEDERALQIVQGVVINDLKDYASLECLTFNGVKEENFITYTITRKFNAQCPGDPTSAPAIPLVRVNLETEEVLVTNLGGEFGPLVQSNTEVRATTTTNTQVSPTSVTPPKVAATIDCGFNTVCFLAAAKNSCAKAKVVQEIKTEHPFVALAYPGLSRISSRSHYEIKGKEGTNCVVYEKFLGGQMTYDQTKLAQLSASDPSIKVEAASVLESYTAANVATAGKDATCKVTSADLQKRITDAAEGNFSVNISASLGGEVTNNDPYAKKCSGPLYTISTLPVRTTASSAGCTLAAPQIYDIAGRPGGVQWIQLQKGVSVSWDISGYKGTKEQVSLRTKNSAVATAELSGKYFMVNSVDYGKTELEVIDMSVGPNCKIIIPVSVSDSPELQ